MTRDTVLGVEGRAHDALASGQRVIRRQVAGTTRARRRCEPDSRRRPLGLGHRPTPRAEALVGLVSDETGRRLRDAGVADASTTVQADICNAR
jgi:hypothetical protein